MHVYLVRHGIAADVSPVGPFDDASRPLTAKGIEKFRAAARSYAACIGQPERVVTSPLVRARETAALLVEQLDWPGELEVAPELVYSAPATIALELLHGARAEQTQSIVLVGHEPHLGSLLGLLLHGSEHAAIPLSKGMCVGVELESSSSLIGRLRFVMSQKLAAALHR